MGTHIHSYCDTPSMLFKRKGTLWRCSCGQLWTIGTNDWRDIFDKEWRRVDGGQDDYRYLAAKIAQLKIEVSQLVSITEDLYQEIEDEPEDDE